jgi:hypothetical protein
VLKYALVGRLPGTGLGGAAVHGDGGDLLRQSAPDPLLLAHSTVGAHGVPSPHAGRWAKGAALDGQIQN